MARPGTPPRTKCSASARGSSGAGRFEDFAGELVTERAIVVGERRVRCVANERVTKAILAAPGVTISARASVSNRKSTISRVMPDEEREDLFDGEAVSENARGAEDAARVGGELVETRLKDAEDRIGERFVAACGAANELFQKKCVALRACDERRNVGFRRAIAERVFHELGGRAFRKWRERDRNDATLGPQARKKLRHLRTRERENESAREERFRITESSTRTEGTSPQCKSSITSTTGRANDAIHSSNAVRSESPIKRASRRAARSTSLDSSGNRTPHISPRSAACVVRSNVPLLRMQPSICRRCVSSSPSLEDAGFAPNRVGDRERTARRRSWDRIARPKRAAVLRALRDARPSSCRMRDFPRPQPP